MFLRALIEAPGSRDNARRRLARSRTNCRAALGLSVALLAGCAHYAPRPIDPAASAQAWSARSLQDEGLHQFLAKTSPTSVATWPLPAWDLDRLTLAAIYEQPDLAVARAQWQVARAGNITAAQRPNPSITAGATYDTSSPPPWIPAVSFDVPIETAGKRGHRIAQAQAADDAAHWDWVGKIWQVRANVRSALLGVYCARQSARLLAQQERAEQEEVRLLEGQLRAGAVAASDLTAPRIALNTTRLALQQGRQQAEEALGALADAIGLPTDALAHTMLSFAGLDRFPAAVTTADVARQTVLQRADVRSALADYAASQAALQLEIANQYPDLHLGPGYEYDQTDNKWTLGVTLPIPVLNRNKGPIAEAEARRRLAAAQFTAIQSKAINEANLALMAYRNALTQAHTAATLLEQLKQRLNSARELRRAGESDSLAVAGAEVEYASGAAQHLDALVKAQQALGRLEAAMQSPLVIPDRVLRTAQAEANADDTHSHEP